MPRARKSPRPLNEAVNTGHQAAKTAPGMPYGERQQLESSLAQAPIPQGPTATASAAGGPGNLSPQPAPPQAGGVTPDQIMAAQQTPFQPVGMFDPSQQPNTPVTAGLMSGPGPGPEALAPPPNPDAQALSGLLPLLEILSSGPGSTYATRNFYRTLQSTVGGQQ